MKKLISVILTAMLLVLPVSASEITLNERYYWSYITGDTDGDKTVTIHDALMALQASVGLIQLDQFQITALEGKAPEATDALGILMKVVGISNEYGKEDCFRIGLNKYKPDKETARCEKCGKESEKLFKIRGRCLNAHICENCAFNNVITEVW